MNYMPGWYWLLLLCVFGPILVVLLLYLAGAANKELSKSPGYQFGRGLAEGFADPHAVQRNFEQLGIVRGMSFEQICEAVGRRPNSISSMQYGSLCEWTESGAFVGVYRIALSFDENGICLDVEHQEFGSGF